MYVFRFGLTIKGVRLLIALLLIIAGPAFAAGKLTNFLVRAETAVFEEADSDPGPVFMLHEGDKIVLWPEDGSGFRKIRVMRYGKKVQGFVRASEVARISDPSVWPKSKWGFGGGGTYTYLSQKKDDFSTADDVEYKPSDFASTEFSPMLVGQYRREDFWRLYLALKPTHFTGSATTNVGGASKSVVIDESFISVMIEKAWTIKRRKPYYYGLVMEYAKARTLELSFNSNRIKTSDEDLRTFIGFEGALGLNYYIGRTWSAFAEARLGSVVNQTPKILEWELAAGVLYWP